jgi:hypothetical protein
MELAVSLLTSAPARALGLIDSRLHQTLKPRPGTDCHGRGFYCSEVAIGRMQPMIRDARESTDTLKLVWLLPPSLGLA